MKKWMVVLMVLVGITFQKANGGILKDSVFKRFNIGFTLGINGSTFRNYEAPNKIFSYYPDTTTVFRPFGPIDQNDTSYLMHYKQNFIQSLRIGLNVGFSFEYYISHRIFIESDFLYQQKGIDINWSENIVFQSIPNNPYSGIDHYYENDSFKIDNNYFTESLRFGYVLLNKKIKLSIMAGAYYSELKYSGLINFAMTKKDSIVYPGPYYSTDYFNEHVYLEDKNLLMTTNYDYGISAGLETNYKLSDRFLVGLNTIINYGFQKVDKRFNNEYNEQLIQYSSGTEKLILSENYFGLNSQSKTIEAALNFKIAYSF
jgi:outer membrane protein with beta-barrel domain